MSYGRNNGLIHQHRMNGHAFRIWENDKGEIKLTIILHWDKGDLHSQEWTSGTTFPNSMHAYDRGECILNGAGCGVCND
tara:strand:+ start:1928 stop:2164 length:237 start_codon:yes stop_codon:yes gene_type:complete